MALRDLMWGIFLSTGEIDAYLLYRECTACSSRLLERAAERE